MAKKHENKLSYLKGFGNYFHSEAIEGTLPELGNTPQKAPKDLYTEQLSGTAFTVPRYKNQRSWLYRMVPSCKHKPFDIMKNHKIISNFNSLVSYPNQVRQKPLDFPTENDKKDFIDGMVTWLGAGSIETKSGVAIHLYSANLSMKNRAFYNADGDFLIVPQEGELLIRTEFGLFDVNPGEICVIQRGIKFSVAIEKPSRGYILEVYNAHFQIPDLGPIGANGLANPKDFESPVASFENPNLFGKENTYEIIQKFCGSLFNTTIDRTPFDVVAQHGNYVPYKYDLDKFCTVNSVSYDHLDPSIFTVLTCQSNEPGVAVADFVIFPPRYMVQENTFRPPYYHRNIMSEYMGNIRGQYEAKLKGFLPGAGSLHNTMIGHGPDSETFEKATNTIELKPVKSPKSDLSFMFESMFCYKLTKYAMNESMIDSDYWKCWESLENNFLKSCKF